MSVASKNIIKFHKVCFGYEQGKSIINNVSFNINNNELIAIVGPNASGKSTLAKIMVGLLKPTTGSIYLENHLINKTNFQLLKDNIGIIFENPDSQLIGFTAEDDIAFGLENKQIEPKKIGEIVSTISNNIGIKDILYVDASKLSGGQKQKIAIASILSLNPKIIIFDEATSMLDEEGRQSLFSLVYELKIKHKKTIIWITHNMDDAAKADRVMVLNKGSIYAFDKPEIVFNKNIKDIGLSQPFALQLSSKLKGVKPSINIEEVVKEVINAK